MKKMTLHRRISRIGVCGGLVLLALALLSVTPLVAAHGGHGGFSQTKVLDNTYYASLEIPNLPYPIAERDLQITVALSSVRDWSREVVVERATLALTGPENRSTAVELTSAGRGAYAAVVQFPEDGPWRANLTITPPSDGNGSRDLSADFDFAVYGPSPYNIASLGAETAAGDTYIVGRPMRAELQVTRLADGAPGPDAPDATARVEWWTDDHKTKLQEFTLPLGSAGGGRLVLETTFEKEGMYHVFVGSPTLDLEYDDRPYVHLYAVTAERAAELGIEVPREAPSVPLAVVVACLGGIALAARRVCAR